MEPYGSCFWFLTPLYSNMGGLSFYEDESGNKYVVGADAVPKKLGSGGISSATLVGSSAGTYKFTDDYTLAVISAFAVRQFNKGISTVTPVSGYENYYEALYSVGSSNATLTHILKNVKKGLQVTIDLAPGDGTSSTASRTEIIGIK